MEKELIQNISIVIFNNISTKEFKIKKVKELLLQYEQKNNNSSS